MLLCNRSQMIADTICICSPSENVLHKFKNSKFHRFATRLLLCCVFYEQKTSSSCHLAVCILCSLSILLFKMLFNYLNQFFFLRSQPLYRYRLANNFYGIFVVNLREIHHFMLAPAEMKKVFFGTSFMGFLFDAFAL